tara:strand:- start:1003 stop:1479 length:477 start_codon:yes stop_codon:yes gene_type:complete
MHPTKFSAKFFKDIRGNLTEIIPAKINKKFIYSILTFSKKNVLRGMHYNKHKDEEKLIYIINGKILDVTINLNKGKNFGKIFYNILKKKQILYIPKGFAHGYVCLGSSNTVLYLLSKKYSKKNNCGFIWNDNYFKIQWKIKRPIVSRKDKKLKKYILS